MLKTTYTLKLCQLFKITLDLKRYMWQKLKLEELSISTKQMSELDVATMVETHSKLDATIIKVDN